MTSHSDPTERNTGQTVHAPKTPAAGLVSSEAMACVVEVMEHLNRLDCADSLQSLDRLRQTIRQESKPETALTMFLGGLVAFALNEPWEAYRTVDAAAQQYPCWEFLEIQAILAKNLGMSGVAQYLGKVSVSYAPLCDGKILPRWLGSYSAVMTLTPNDIVARSSDTLWRAGETDQAVRSLSDALEFPEQHVSAWSLLAEILTTGRIAGKQGVFAWEALASVAPLTHRQALWMVHALVQAQEFGHAQELLAQARRSAKSVTETAALATAEKALVVHKVVDNVGLRKAQRLLERENARRTQKPPSGRKRVVETSVLRVGVVCGHIHAGSLFDLVAPVLLARFTLPLELSVYHLGPNNSTHAERWSARCARWRNLGALDDETLATIITNDAPDVVLDCDGIWGIRFPAWKELVDVPVVMGLGATTPSGDGERQPSAFAASLLDPMIAAEGHAAPDGIVLPFPLLRWNPETALPRADKHPIALHDKDNPFTVGLVGPIPVHDSEIMAVLADITNALSWARFACAPMGMEENSPTDAAGEPASKLARVLPPHRRMAVADVSRLMEVSHTVLDLTTMGPQVEVFHALARAIPAFAVPGRVPERRLGAGLLFGCGLAETYAGSAKTLGASFVAAVERWRDDPSSWVEARVGLGRTIASCHDDESLMNHQRILFNTLANVRAGTAADTPTPGESPKNASASPTHAPS